MLSVCVDCRNYRLRIIHDTLAAYVSRSWWLHSTGGQKLWFPIKYM